MLLLFCEESCSLHMQLAMLVLLTEVVVQLTNQLLAPVQYSSTVHLYMNL